MTSKPRQPTINWSLPVDDPSNLAVAKTLGWKLDFDYHAYRDEHDHLIEYGGSGQPNAVDSLR